MNFKVGDIVRPIEPDFHTRLEVLIDEEDGFVAVKVLENKTNRQVGCEYAVRESSLELVEPRKEYTFEDIKELIRRGNPGASEEEIHELAILCC